jgi:predicted aspartyl protease
MSAESTVATGGPPRLVGQVFTEMTIRNRDDIALARAGHLEPSSVRSIQLERVLVDTGATHICLPSAMIAELGLSHLRDVVVSTAAGAHPSRVAGPAELEIEGRITFVEVLELPDGSRPLLGVVPMESLGLEPDLLNQRLLLLPETGPETHFTAY